MSKNTLETFQFTNLAELRDWLNAFEVTDLTTVNIETDDSFHVSISWVEETLTDGSVVNNAHFRTV